MNGSAPDFHGRLVPKLVSVLREGYSRRTFGRDVLAGAVVGIVALPLAIAFAIASGVKPEQGLTTAVIAGFIISALGGSRVQIGGPTGAFVVIIAGIVEKHGVEGLALATAMAGVLLVLMGVVRLGAVIQFVPYPVTVGFTSGIALYIGVSQVRDFLGLSMERVPADFIEKIGAYAEHIATWRPAAAVVGALTVAIIALWPRVTRRVPGSIIAIFAMTALAHGLDLPVETIGDRFGGVPSAIPAPRLPSITLEALRDLSGPALAIAFLGGVESLLSAVVADGMTGFRHRSNMELVAQGVANIVTPLFGGIPATGAIARTATNIKNGGRTPIAGMVHALVLLAIMLFAGRWAALIPMSVLAGILLVVAYHMSEWRHFVGLFRSPRQDVAVLLATFFLTVVVDLVVAIEVGMVLAAFLFMHRMASLSQAGFITGMLREDRDRSDTKSITTRHVPEGVEVFEVYGSFFFGAASKFRDAVRRVERQPRVFILRMREVPVIDATALRAIEDLAEKTASDGTVLILSGVREQPRNALRRAGVLGRIGEENIAADVDDALARARAILGLPPEGHEGAELPLAGGGVV